ncbi:MAG: sugar isomerase [Victivallales bacterium]
MQSLYKPIAEKNHTAINRILAATHRLYTRTGWIYLGLVVLLSILYPFFANTGFLSKFSVFAVILLAGIPSAVSFFIQGKYRILLGATGEGYILTNIATVGFVASSFFKVGILLCHGGLVAIQVSCFLVGLLQMGYIVLYIRRHYRWIDLKVVPDFDSVAQRKAVLVHQISGLIFNNTDMLILTFMTSLKTVSVYTMYAMIYGMVKAFAYTISEGFGYSLGQAFHEREHFLRLFNVYEVYNISIMFSMFCIGSVLILPFLKLYTAGVTDINYIDWKLSMLFVVFYLLHNGRCSSGAVIGIAQKFNDTKWRSILESAINITASLVLTYFLGIYGVLLGTIIALLYRTNDMIIYASGILKRSCWITYRRWSLNLFLFAVILLFFHWFDLKCNNYFEMIAVGAVIAPVIFIVFQTVNSLVEYKVWKDAKEIFRQHFYARFLRIFNIRTNFRTP